MKKIAIWMLMGIVLGDLALVGSGRPEMVPVRPRCEFREDPLGIDAEIPRLSWIIAERRSFALAAVKGTSPNAGPGAEMPRGQKQTAYQVLVASSERLLAKDQGDLWDRGKVASDQSVHAACGGPSRSPGKGKSLQSRQACYWKVRTWDKDGRVSDWSRPTSWSMGLLKPEDRQAKWIKAPGSETSPWIRKEFTSAAAPDRATVFVNVMGYYELYVNGRKVGDEVLAPAVSVYPKRSLYGTYDIGRFLHAGANCVGVWLGTGWHWPGPIARVELYISVGGRRETIGTDRTWTFVSSTHAELRMWKWSANGSERIDARREIPGWSEPGGPAGE